MLARILFASAFLPFVTAQASRDLGFEIEAIEAHFNQSHIVPDFLPSFSPKGILDVNFNRNLDPGQDFSKEQVGRSPAMMVQSSGALNGPYVLAMMDAGPPDVVISIGTNRHWLLFNVTILQNSTVSNASATSITPYAGPNPPAGSGPHRYVIVIYEQPPNFAPPAEFSRPGLPVAPMNWTAFVTESNLGALVAANYIQVEVGTASATISSTAPVITSTLAPLSTSASPLPPSPSSPAASNENGNTNSACSLSIDIILVIALTALIACLLPIT